jgi:hypothetical protein
VAGLGSFLPPVILEIQASAKEASARWKQSSAELTVMGKKAEVT